MYCQSYTGVSKFKAEMFKVFEAQMSYLDQVKKRKCPVPGCVVTKKTIGWRQIVGAVIVSEQPYLLILY